MQLALLSTLQAAGQGNAQILAHDYLRYIRLEALLANIEVIDYARFIDMLTWTAVICLTFKSWMRLLFYPKKALVFDTVQALFACFGILILGFRFRWYLAQDSVFIHTGLYVLSTIIASTTVWISYRYRNVWEKPT